MPMYNLIEYGVHYSKTTRSYLQLWRDDPDAMIRDSISSKLMVIITEKLLMTEIQEMLK